MLIISDLTIFIILQINRSRAAEGKEKEKCYEDKETFKDRMETVRYGQVGASL